MNQMLLQICLFLLFSVVIFNSREMNYQQTKWHHAIRHEQVVESDIACSSTTPSSRRYEARTLQADTMAPVKKQKNEKRNDKIRSFILSLLFYVTVISVASSSVPSNAFNAISKSISSKLCFEKNQQITTFLSSKLLQKALFGRTIATVSSFAIASRQVLAVESCHRRHLLLSTFDSVYFFQFCCFN